MKKLFTAPQIRAWDTYTIKHTPIDSIELMEHACTAFTNWFASLYKINQNVFVICGPGNNGGDGFAICRQLSDRGYQVTPYLINPNESLSKDCEINLKKLKQIKDWKLLKSTSLTNDDVIIDAIFGTGLTREVNGEYAELITLLNQSNGIKVSVDIPSGLYCDSNNKPNDIIFKADQVLTFEIPKRSFFFIENQAIIKKFVIANIGLHALFYKQTHCNWLQINATNDIPNYHENNIITIHPEQFETLYSCSFITSKAIAKLTQKSIQEQKIIALKAYSEFYFTPKGGIYVILNP